MRVVPMIATSVVLLAVGLMVALGLWQIQRLHQKEALIAHYSAAKGNAAPVVWSGDEARGLYRRTTLECLSVKERGGIAGRNEKGQSGIAQTARCRLSGGEEALVVMGWSQAPQAGSSWSGGRVSGVIAPGPRLVADPPLAGLEANAIPDPADLPNNHFAYAVQWFLFAGTALLIFGIALRRRKTA